MKNINENAPVKCTKSIIINAKADKVWSILTNIDQWSSWNSEISHVKMNGQLMPSTTFDWKTGGAKIHSTLHTVEPQKAFGWTGKAFGMYAIHNWKLSDENGQTKVSVDESMEGFFASIFKNMFNKSLEKGMQNWLDFLKVICENE